MHKIHKEKDKLRKKWFILQAEFRVNMKDPGCTGLKNKTVVHFLSIWHRSLKERNDPKVNIKS